MMAPHTSTVRSLFLLVLFPALSFGASTLPIPHAVHYIGIGYNILDGNPEGDNRAAGGVDPGLLVSRRIFQLSYDKNKVTNDRVYRVPDQVEFQHRSSSFTSKQKDTFFGTKSYAKKLSHQVNADVSVEAVFASVKFAASHRYESIKNEASTKGYVYFSEQTINNYGHMRYQSSLARHDGYEIDREFRIEVCALPTTYSTNPYMAFLSKWGTSVVTECDVGVRSGENYREDRSSFVRDASTDMSNSVSVEGSYKIVSASLAVDMDRYTKSESSEKKFGSKYTSYTIGSQEHNEPITISIIGLDEALGGNYWSKQAEYESSKECPANWPRATIAANILKALKEYATYRGVVPSSDPDVRVPLTWPDGKYALPEAVKSSHPSGDTCPNTNYLTWSFGLFYQPTAAGSKCSKGQHLTNYCKSEDIRSYYCVKTSPKSTTDSWVWSPGVYCIYKYGDSCPDGFKEGSIKWADAGLQKGVDPDYSTTPAGTYAHQDTEIEFCCRQDGQISTPIFLPTEKPFYLIQYHEGCQQIHGMSVTQEWILWATRQAVPRTYQTGAYPQPGNTGHDVKINYCYYQPKASRKRFMDELEEAVELYEQVRAEEEEEKRADREMIEQFEREEREMAERDEERQERELIGNEEEWEGRELGEREEREDMTEREEDEMLERLVEEISKFEERKMADGKLSENKSSHQQAGELQKGDDQKIGHGMAANDTEATSNHSKDHETGERGGQKEEMTEREVDELLMERLAEITGRKIAEREREERELAERAIAKSKLSEQKSTHNHTEDLHKAQDQNSWHGVANLDKEGKPKKFEDFLEMLLGNQ